MARSSTSLAVRYGVVLVTVVAGTLALGSVLWQLGGQGAHAGHGSLGISPLGVAVDAAGVGTSALLGLQLMSGYHLIRLRGDRFRRVHIALGLSLGAAAILHGAGAVAHTLQRVEVLPVALDVMGVVLVAALGVQVASGYRQTRSRALRATHIALALVVGAAIAAHALLGVYHTITG